MTESGNQDSQQICDKSVEKNGNSTTVRVRIWDKWADDYSDKPDEIVTVERDDPHLWQDDPYFDSGAAAFDIHPGDTPATLYIYTNDSVRPAPVGNRVDTAAWDGPVERGLPFDEDYTGGPPFGCQIWGRVLFLVEEGLTR